MLSDETRQRWKRELETVTAYVEMGQYTLTDWETEFLDSIGIRLAGGFDLTMQQSVALNQIWEKTGQ